MRLLFHKTLHFAPLTLLVALLFSGMHANAQGTLSGYQLLADIPTIGKTTGITLVDYMKGLFVATIGLAIVLAVVEIVIGGIGYVAAAIPSAKEDAKKRIGGAVGGLLLILLAWVLLQALNPELLRVGLNLENVAVTSQTTAADTTNGTQTTTSTVTPSEYVAADDTARAYLEAGGVQVKGNQCTYEGQSGCTSVFGLPASAMDGLIALKTDCACDVFVSGGTEAGHETHGVGNAIVDLRHNKSLDAYLTNVACTKNGRNVYVNNGNYYWDEDSAHFHVTYGASQC